MNNPLVSIVVPVYNCDKYIVKCLTSILKQSYKNIEVIVINDGSSDDSEIKIRELQQKDRRLSLISRENQGVSFARNIGVKFAKGKYLTFVDGDDYIGENYIKNFVEIAEKEKSDLCISGYVMVDENAKILSRYIPKKKYARYEHEEYAYRVLATLSRFYKLSFWKEIRVSFEGERGVRGEDIPVALLTNALAKNIRYVFEADYFYVQHSSSARNNMQGLKQYQLPYAALEECIKKVDSQKNGNGKDFFELGVFRVFTTFLFDLGRGASVEKKEEVYRFEKKIIEKYFPDYMKNSRMRFFSDLDIPFFQKVATSLYRVMYHRGWLLVVAKFL